MPTPHSNNYKKLAPQTQQAIDGVVIKIGGREIPADVNQTKYTLREAPIGSQVTVDLAFTIGNRTQRSLFTTYKFTVN